MGGRLQGARCGRERPAMDGGMETRDTGQTSRVAGRR